MLTVFATALKKFREQAFAESDRQTMAHARNPNIDSSIGKYVRANTLYWFEHDLREYPAVYLDLEALKARSDRIVPIVGRESRGYPRYEVNVELGKKLGRKLIELPGGHIGFLAHPAEFARELLHTSANRT